MIWHRFWKSIKRYPQLPSAILGILVEFGSLYSARILLGISCKLPMAESYGNLGGMASAALA
jgi:hypothetical protein